MYCYLIAKIVDITWFSLKSYKNNRTKENPVTLVTGFFLYYSFFNIHHSLFI